MKGLIDLIGNTPLVELKKINTHPKVKLYGKLEGHNPGGSVKDRAALGLIQGALDDGIIQPHTKLIEATSGNTGIALAMIAQLKGISIELVMPENSTIERVKTMRAFGAKVTLTPAEGGMETARDYVTEKVEKEGFVCLDQFNNPHNSRMHYGTTGPEIWHDTEGQITHFVSAMGTTGTISGVGQFLKEQNPNVKIVGAQPAEGAKIPGIRKWPEAYLPGIFRSELVDQTIDVSEQNAREMARRLALEEGVFSGMSSGGCVYVATELIKSMEEGVVVCIICDRGDKYLSTDLFDF